MKNPKTGQMMTEAEIQNAIGIMKVQKAKAAEIQAKPLTQDALKGKVDIKWYGHCGFKIGFKDKDGVQRSVYIDIFIDNKDCPEEHKKEAPNDADLALVTHGQMDHSMHAPFLMMVGKKEERKIVCTAEVATYYQLFRKLPPQLMKKMQPGGTLDLGWVKITMVRADHPSTCIGPQGVQIPGGIACGFVINIPNHNLTIYHAGDTNVFSDMKLINDLYKPTIAMLPIGDCIGMGPREAAYAAKNFLPNVKTFVPMSFNTFPVFTGTPDDFEAQLKEFGVDGKMVHPKEYLEGKALLE